MINIIIANIIDVSEGCHEIKQCICCQTIGTWLPFETQYRRIVYYTQKWKMKTAHSFSSICSDAQKLCCQSSVCFETIQAAGHCKCRGFFLLLRSSLSSAVLQNMPFDPVAIIINRSSLSSMHLLRAVWEAVFIIDTSLHHDVLHQCLMQVLSRINFSRFSFKILGRYSR